MNGETKRLTVEEIRWRAEQMIRDHIEEAPDFKGVRFPANFVGARFTGDGDLIVNFRVQRRDVERALPITALAAWASAGHRPFATLVVVAARAW